MRPHPTIRTLFAALLLVSASACGGNNDLDPVVGTWLATTFQVAPFGQGPTNVLASGGTLGLNVANKNFVTAGTLIIPASLAGGTTFTASMAGTAVRTDNIVRFTQPADTFVRDLTFTLVENRLEALNQTVSGTRYDIILTRQ
jgi:hypothetical protein